MPNTAENTRLETWPPWPLWPNALPFHTTHSERRIIQELIAIGELRESGFAARAITPDFLSAEKIHSAQKLIEHLEEILFPQEVKLRQKRAALLQDLNGGVLRVHFDNSLETATLTLQARVQNAAEFDDLLRRLQRFDFAAWQEHCASERADAD